MRYPFGYIYPSYLPYMSRQYAIDNLMYRYPSAPTNPIKIITKEVIYSNEYIKGNLKYPEIEGIENQQIQDFINNSIKNDIMEFKDQMNVAAKETAEEARRQGREFIPFVISCIYEVTYNKNNIISISIIYHELINGIHSYIKVSYNFNLKTGEPLSLKDLFKEGVDYQSVIDKAIRQELALNEERYFPDTLENFKGIARDQPFYIENGDIVIYFGFHEIAPVASQIPVIKIPFYLLSNYVKPMYLN